MKLGVQLFGAMRLYNEDTESFLRSLKDAGYDVIEPCVGFGENPMPFVWPANNLQPHVERARALGLELDSFHSFAGEFWKMIPEHVAVCKEAGFKHVVLGYRGAFEKAACDEFAQHCIEMADGLAEHGIGLWLHNSWQEIAGKVAGVSAYEYILNACGGKLGAQVDTGWVVCGGLDLVDFLARNERYVQSIHHKDVATLLDADNRTENVSLGRGIVDTVAAFEFGKAHGLLQLVDQDNSAGSLAEDLHNSARYIKGL